MRNSKSHKHTITTKWSVIIKPKWLLLNFGLLWKSVTCAQRLSWSFLGFCDSGTWRKRNKRTGAKGEERVTWERRRFQERLKSKVAFTITLRWALHGRCTSKLTGLSAHGRRNTQACTHTQSWETHISRMTDACTFTLDIYMKTNMYTGYGNTHTWTHTQTAQWGQRKQRPCVCEKPLRGGEQSMYLCSSPPLPPPPPARTPSHTLPVPHSV